MSNKPKRGRPRKNVETAQGLSLENLTKEQLIELLKQKEQEQEQNNEKNIRTKQARFVKNKFVDTGTKVTIANTSIESCKEDRDFTKKVKAVTSKRSRKTIVHKNECNTCHKKFEAATSSEFICPNCMGIKK